VCGIGSNNVYGCHQTVCGDGHQEGSEQCDDATCSHSTPARRPARSCRVQRRYLHRDVRGCLVFAPEECDDGNVQDGDGCSHDCKLEPSSGFSCVTNNQPPPQTLVIPILYHDMRYNNTPNGSADFQNFNPGVVLFGLVKGKPGYRRQADVGGQLRVP